MKNPHASCAANNLQIISQAALRAPILLLTQTTVDGILCELLRTSLEISKLLHQATEQRNMFRGGITPHQQRTTAASYHIANILAKAIVPLQHGKLVQSVKILFPERADVLRTVEQVPLSRNTRTRCVEDIADHLASTIWKNLRRCEAFSVAFR